MIFAPTPQSEQERLLAVHELIILDTPRETQFDEITQNIAHKIDVPICLITIIDQDRQWFKSTFGISISEIPRAISICGHAISDTHACKSCDRIYEVYDTRNDIRFFDNPFTVNKPWIRSYISFVLQSESGMNIGTLCLLNAKPKIYTKQEKQLIIEAGEKTEFLINNIS